MSAIPELQFFVSIIGEAYVKKSMISSEINELKSTNNDINTQNLINQKKDERKRIQRHIEKLTHELNAYYSK